MVTELQSAQKRQGFTLIELLLVISIIGLLAAIAVPNFQIYARRARRVEAKQELGHIRRLQEIYLNEHSNYAKTIAELRYELPTGISNYEYKIVDDKTATATGKAGVDVEGETWTLTYVSGDISCTTGC